LADGLSASVFSLMTDIVTGASRSCCSVFDAETTTSSFRVICGSSGFFSSGLGVGFGVCSGGFAVVPWVAAVCPDAVVCPAYAQELTESATTNPMANDRHNFIGILLTASRTRRRTDVTVM
jgi:hypothetical protein